MGSLYHLRLAGPSWRRPRRVRPPVPLLLSRRRSPHRIALDDDRYRGRPPARPPAGLGWKRVPVRPPIPGPISEQEAHRGIERIAVG